MALPIPRRLYDSEAAQFCFSRIQMELKTPMPENKRAALKEWLSSGKVGLHPLTFPQRELWEASPVSVADTANHICCLIHLRGFVTREMCEAALQRVVERQEVLRLSFLPGKDRPL